jgi:hypothetical protein
VRNGYEITNIAKRLGLLLDIEEDSILSPSVLRSLCIRTGVPADLFGLELEEPYDPGDGF